MDSLAARVSTDRHGLWNTFSNCSERTHCWNHRWQVWCEGYLAGNSRPCAPVRRIHSTPFPPCVRRRTTAPVGALGKPQQRLQHRPICIRHLTRARISWSADSPKLLPLCCHPHETSSQKHRPTIVESRASAGADAEATPRFSYPLIKPDMPVSSLRLSDGLHRKAHARRGGGPSRKTLNSPKIR
jgi:hypothetical protein